jgi:hypothetical protein
MKEDAAEIFREAERFFMQAGWDRQVFPRDQFSDAVDAFCNPLPMAASIALGCDRRWSANHSSPR